MGLPPRRPCRSRCWVAAREQHELGVAIGLSVLSEQLLPSGLRVVEHERDEVPWRVTAFGRDCGASH